MNKEEQFKSQPIYNVKKAVAIDKNFRPDYYTQLEYDKIKENYSAKCIVGVIDSGAEARHEHWKVKPVQRKDYTGRGLEAGSHGTHVTGIISSYYGISDNIPTISYKALTEAGGSGRWIAKAIDQAIRDGVEILNLSLGSNYRDKHIERALKRFIENPRCFAICASGNDGWDGAQSTDYPAKLADKYRGIISVGAADFNGGSPTLAHFSSKGTVTVSAQGVDVLSTVKNDGLEFFSGTSMAAPKVAALISYAKTIYPDFQQADFNYIAKEACIDMHIEGKDSNTGYGFLIPMLFLSEVANLKPIFAPPPKVHKPSVWCYFKNLLNI